MQSCATSWVAVRVAAEAIGVSESRLRTAYRNGQLSVRDDLVNGRQLKVLDLDEVRAWAGVPTPEPAEPEAPTSSLGPSLDAQLEQLAGDVQAALARAARAERELSMLRNEFAQLRAAHTRVQEIVDRQHAEVFRAAMSTACGEVLQGRRRRGLLSVLTRRTV